MSKSPGNGAFAWTWKKVFHAVALLASCLLAACTPPPAPVSRCWVQVFASPEFDPRGIHDIFFGPGAWPVMSGLPRARMDDWGGAVQSLITGPEGRLYLWSRPDFAGTLIEVGPDRQIVSLSACGLPPVESMALECR